MCILTREEILKEIRAGNIKIEPFTEDMAGPASVDLTLGNNFRIFKKYHNIYPINNDVQYDRITEEVTVNKRFVLMP